MRSDPEKQGMHESWECRRSQCTVKDLDPELLAQARAGAGLSAWTDEEYLLRRRLADRRGHQTVLRRAAELLFARHEPDHPNAGIRVFRVIGTERRFGVEHNVEERPRTEGSLPKVLDEARSAVASLLRWPSRLLGVRFQEMPEYPDFAWREAVHNAVAHRDYAIQGAGTEIWMFEDRMEVVSAGAGAASYYTVSPALCEQIGQRSGADRGELGSDRAEFAERIGDTSARIEGSSGVDRGELGSDRGELPADVRSMIDRLGSRPRKERLRAAIEAICMAREWTTSGEMSRFLRFSQRNLSSRHLTPMVEAGQLARRYPNSPNHPEQAYRVRRQLVDS